jgi:GT2 family glycosyltransferase
MTTIGVIIIGRNEGPRLLACLESIRKSTEKSVVEIVYVDSHSTDASVELANRHAHVVVLDPALPFTAARARNAGAETLLARHPDVTYLQFLDGDTTLDPTWLKHAAGYLDHHPAIAVVCGRRRERFPEATIYNLLADMEWDTPIGPAKEFGGDALLRAAVFQELGGYSPHFIAGEEPEFAARLRLAGHKIVRLNHEMTLHDLAMTRIVQWWKRTVRSGHALAQLAHTHGHAPLHLYQKQWRSTLLWTLAVPALILLLTLLSPWALLLFPLASLTLATRIMRYRLRRGDDRDSALLYALFTTLGKFPQLLGMATFYRNLWRKRQSTLIEYKPPAATPAAANPAPAVIGST